MPQYIVSARKYRPDSFETLIGQDNISTTLKNSILRGQLAHAYLFCGPRGVGKTSTARIFAKTINCSNPGADMQPCGECESCRSFAEGRSYCIHELDAASNNGVEDIKTLMDQVQIPPQVGKYSVYIIDEVHMLSQSAFNAFLKTLEEPPAHAIFILCTTEKHKILPTILSRCQTYDFNRISIPDMVRNLRMVASSEQVEIDDESLHVIARKADGAMRDALTIFDQTVAFCGNHIKYEDVIRNLNVLDTEYGFRLVDAFLSADYATAFLILDEVLAKGFNALHFVSSLSSHLRDLLVSRTGGLEVLLDMPDSLKARYAEQGGRCSVQFLYDALGITSQCEAGFKTSSNQRLHIEYALMRLCFLSGAPATVAAEPSAAAPKPAAIPQAAPQPVQEGAVTPKPAIPAAETVETAAATEPAAPAETVEEPSPAEAPAASPQAAPQMVQPDEGETPKPAEEPAAKPKRRTAASLSLASLMGKDGGESGAEAKQAPDSEGTVPSDEEIGLKWQEFVTAFSGDRDRLRTALIKSGLSFGDEGEFRIVRFEVTNVAQKKWIEEKLLREMEESINRFFSTTLLRLSVEVAPEEEAAPLIYTPEEKMRELMGKNPEVRELVKEMGLETK